MIYIVSILYALSFYLGKITFSFADKNVPIFYYEIITLLLLVYFLLRKKNAKLIVSKYLIILCCLFIISMIPIFYSKDFLRAFEAPKTFIFMILSYVLFTNLFTSINTNEAEKFILLFSYTFTLLIIIGIFYIVYLNQLYLVETIFQYKRYFELPFGKSNYIAAFVSYFSILYLFNYFRYNRKMDMMLFFISSFVLIILNSRSSTLALLTTVIILFLTNIRKINTKKKLFFFVTILLVFCIISQSNFYNLLVNRFTIETYNVKSRVTHYKLVLDYILHDSNVVSLLIGQGMGTEKAFFEVDLLIHNIFFKLIYSIGFIGGILYFIYYSYYIKLLIRGKNNIKYFYAFFSLFIVSLAEPVLFTPLIEYFMTIYICNSLILDKSTKSTYLNY